MANKDPKYLNIFALIPSTVITLLYFAVELAVSILLGTVLIKYYPQTSSKLLAGIVILVVIFFEALHRLGSWNYKIIWNFFLTRNKTFQFLGRSFGGKRFPYFILTRAYLIVTAAFFAFSYKYVLSALNQPTSTSESTELVTNGIGIVSGALAIFFTVAAVVVQNLLDKYSHVFLKKVIGNFVFVISFFFMLVFIVGGLCLLHFGSNELFNNLCFYATIYAIFDMGVMTWLLIYFLDVTNVIAFIAAEGHKIIRKIPKGKKRKKRRRMNEEIEDERESDLTRKLTVHMFFTNWILGSYKSGTLTEAFLPAFDVPQHFKDELKQRIRPIPSACMKAMNEDNRDVVLSCLGELAGIADAYLKRRTNYSGMDDDFLMSLYSELEILFDNSVKVPNQQYTSDIINTVRSIAISCIGISESQLREGENGLVQTWLTFLQESVFKAIHLKHTSAPMQAISTLTDISVALVHKNVFTTGIYGAVEYLKRIGILTAKLPSSWPGSLCQRSIAGLVKVLDTLFLKLQKQEWIMDLAVSKVCDDIEKVMDAAYETERDFMSYGMISAPVVGSLWRERKISVIIQNALAHTYTDRRFETHALRDTKHILEMLRHVGAKAVSSGKGTAYEYFMAFSELAHTAIHYMLYVDKQEESEDTDNLRMVANEFLDKVVCESTNLLSWYRSSDSHVMNALEQLSPICAFLTYYARGGEHIEIFQARNKFIERMLEGYSSFTPKSPQQERKKDEIYEFLKMFGAWLYRYSRKDPLTIKLVKVLAKDYRETPEQSRHYMSYSSSEMEMMGYPSDHIASQWFIPPSDFWPGEHWDVTNELNNIAAYRKYDRLLKKMNSKKPIAESKKPKKK